MNAEHRQFFLVALGLALLTATIPSAAQPDSSSAAYLPVGVYLGDISEGARIITFIRLFPVGHPMAEEHTYPTASVLHRTEVELLIHMGRQLDFNLYATLNRFPDPPTGEWQWPEFEPPPVEVLTGGESGPFPDEVAIPGLVALACLNRGPLAYLVDTRDLTLEERGMERATSSGLDMSRDIFEQELRRICGAGTGARLYIRNSR